MLSAFSQFSQWGVHMYITGGGGGAPFSQEGKGGHGYRVPEMRLVLVAKMRLVQVAEMRLVLVAEIRLVLVPEVRLVLVAKTRW